MLTAEEIAFSRKECISAEHLTPNSLENEHTSNIIDRIDCIYAFGNKEDDTEGLQYKDSQHPGAA